MSKTALRIFCAFVLIGVLVAGLWPFHAPKNDVSWLSNGDGVRFGKYGLILYSAGNLPIAKDATSCSIEIWLQPDRIDAGGTVLAYYSQENQAVTFSLHQSLDDLFLRRVIVRKPRPLKAKWYVEHLFAENKQIFVTITSGPKQTAVYVNGRSVAASPACIFSSKDLGGQLVIGNNPVTDNGWPGRLRGLAIYNRELTPAEVSQHYLAWTTNRQFEIQKQSPAALYLFNERRGKEVHNQMDSGTDLRIPDRYLVLHQQFLEPPWEEFDPSWGYCKDVLVNISGFVPLGFLFCAYISVRRLKRPVLAAIIFGAIVSFAIEVLQSFLPTRNSGITDLITNTLGAGLGALLYDCEWAKALVTTFGLGGCLESFLSKP